MSLDILRFKGFDESKHVPFTKQYRVKCSACNALVINGTPTHEHGCPNKPSECRECGCMIPAGERCDCLDWADQC